MRFLILSLTLAVAATACGGGADTLTVYSGRAESLVGPLIDLFVEETGISVEVRYADSTDLALLIAEEGDRSPADVFISQSPGAIGFLAEMDRLQPIDPRVLELVDASFRSSSGRWVGLSGRVRVLVYNTDLVSESDLPASVFDLTDPRFVAAVGIAPANGSFQDFVTAMREIHGDAVTAEWLAGLEANDAQTYAKNSAIVQAVARGEVPMGLVNHYYNLQALAEDPSLPSVNHFFPNGDVGSLVITTAAGVLDTADSGEAAARFLEFLLGDTAQRFFRDQTREYPVIATIGPPDGLPPLDQLDVATYDFDVLAGGLERTKELIDASGLEAP